MTSPRPDTWMPWYIGDYQRDTMHLDADQDGAYRRLIDACWVRHGLLPDDDAQFAVITKLGPKRWKAARPVVAVFFQITPDGWRHKRVDAELLKAKANTEARQLGGQKTAAKRWSGDSSAMRQLHADEPLSGRPSPSPSPSPKKNPPIGPPPGGATLTGSLIGMKVGRTR